MAEETDIGRRRIGAENRPQRRREGRNVVFGAKKKLAFLAELGATCNVAASARAVEVPESTIYKARLRDAEFRRDWAAALAEGYGRLEMSLLEGAIRGVGGEIGAKAPADGGRTREQSDRLALALLSLHAKAVAVERARAEAEARDGADGVRDDPVGTLIERLDAMSERMRAED